MFSYNEIFGKQIDHTKTVYTEIDILLTKPPVNYLDLDILLEDQDLTTLTEELKEEQLLQNEIEKLELQLFRKKHPRSKKLPAKKPKIFFDLPTSYNILFPHDYNQNYWFWSSFNRSNSLTYLIN